MTFRILENNGRTTYITAKCRSDAISKFRAKTGCPAEFIRKHCIVKTVSSIDEPEPQDA